MDREGVVLSLLDNITMCDRVCGSFEMLFDGIENISERRHECLDVTVVAYWES